MPAAAYKGSSSWAVSSSPHQLHAGVQLGSPADTPIGPKPPSNGANHGLPTPPTRWIAIPIHHPVNFKPIAVSSAFAAARAAPAVPRRISFGRSIPVPVDHSGPAQASEQPALPSPASSLQGGQERAGREPQQHSESLALRQMPSKRKATLHLPESSQQTAATGDTHHDEEEESDRAVKRSKHGLRKLNERGQMQHHHHHRGSSRLSRLFEASVTGRGASIRTKLICRQACKKTILTVWQPSWRRLSWRPRSNNCSTSSR